ncbi:Tyrosinase [Arthrobotrys entomopaga]|nr:Tyrosinase [Arthrobotrys entomopaga]
MAGWSSLKICILASYALSLSLCHVKALPTTSVSASGSEAYHSSLTTRQQSPFIITGVREGVTQAGQVPVRKEIRDMINNRTEFELFLLALQRFYSVPQNSDLSYYAVSGVHGRPFKPWAAVPNTRGANPNNGYCTHADILFLPWHRPYLATYEQFLWNHARDVVNSFPASDSRKAAFAAVLPGFRIPYWDWASDSSVPAEVAQIQMIEVANPKGGRQTIANPLYSYKFTDLRELPEAPFNSMGETFRWPRINNGRYESQPVALNNAMTAVGGNLRSRVYQVLTAQVYKDFNLVGTKVTTHPAQIPDSLEAIHDTIHSTVGGHSNILGHMGQVPYSAFDPVS